MELKEFDKLSETNPELIVKVMLATGYTYKELKYRIAYGWGGLGKYTSKTEDKNLSDWYDYLMDNSEGVSIDDLDDLEFDIEPWDGDGSLTNKGSTEKGWQPDECIDFTKIKIRDTF